LATASVALTAVTAWQEMPQTFCDEAKEYLGQAVTDFQIVRPMQINADLEN
jgi:hypothetical protein